MHDCNLLFWFSRVARLTIGTLVTLLMMIVTAPGQDLVGKYAAYYGHTLHLREDSTFRYEWQFDLASSWSVGTWRVQKRTLHLNIKTVLDTLTREGQPDSLVLSADEKSNRIQVEDFAITLITGGGQGRAIDRITDRFSVRGKKLHPLNAAGQIVRRRETGIWNKRKRPIYFFKTT